MCDCDITCAAYIPYWLVAARAVHFASCLLVFGVCAFDRFAAGPVAQRGPEDAGSPWRFWNSAARLMLLLGLITVLLSGAAWFLLVIKDSFWDPAGASFQETARIVWARTQFGKLSQFRVMLWLAAAVAALPVLLLNRPTLVRAAWVWAVLLLSSGLTATLAWAGHGQEGSDATASWHLAADVMHLLVSGFWPTGLLPFGLLLFRLRRTSSREKWQVAAEVTRRYSAISLLSVALLTATGLANSWFLVHSWPALYQTWYGKVLLLKVGFFGLMVAIGAVNLLFLKPRLSTNATVLTDAAGPARGLQFNVAVELVLGALVIMAVAFLGALPPPLQ